MVLNNRYSKECYMLNRFEFFVSLLGVIQGSFVGPLGISHAARAFSLRARRGGPCKAVDYQ